MTTEFRRHLATSLTDPEFALGFGAELAKSEFAVALATARRRKTLTQHALAEKAGVTQAYVAKLESGEANPTLSVVGKLLAVMGLGLVIGTQPLVGAGQEPFAIGLRMPDDMIRPDEELVVEDIGTPDTATRWTMAQLGPAQRSPTFVAR